MRGRIHFGAVAALCFTMPAASFGQSLPSVPAAAVPIAASPIADTKPVNPAPPAALILPEGTPIAVVLESDITTASNRVGDEFPVTVVDDVAVSGVVVIPKGTSGYGEVTFVSRNRSFGAAGMLGITLRTLDLNGTPVQIDGHYRQEGKSADGAAAATMFAVGIFAALVKGKVSIIPKGRVLKARTGQDIPYPTAVPAAAITNVSPITTAPPDAAATSLTPASATATAQPAADQPPIAKTN